VPEVIELKQIKEARKNSPLTEKEIDCRRLALQLAVQLPRNGADAVLVVEALRILVETFLAPGGL
jgi:hypothetical protein